MDHKLRVRYTLCDENIPGIQFSDPAQNGQTHGIKYKRILIFELQLYKPSWIDSLKSYN